MSGSPQSASIPPTLAPALSGGTRFKKPLWGTARCRCQGSYSSSSRSMSAPPAGKHWVRTTLHPNPTQPIPSGERPAYVGRYPEDDKNTRRAGLWFLSVHEYDRSRHSRSAKSTIRRLGLFPTWQDVVKNADDLREDKEGRSSKPSRPPPDDPFAIGEALPTCVGVFRE